MDQELTLRDYVAILKRRYLWFFPPFIGVLGATIVAVVSSTPIYQSTGTILVESQRISDELIRSTVTSMAEDRIRTIEQRVMTRARLVAIGRSFRLTGHDQEPLTDDEIVDLVRANARIEFVSTEHGGRWRGADTAAFKVAYRDRNPVIAQQIANELITLFLEENIRTRTERAAETTDFLAQEGRRLKQQLDEIERQVVTIKQENQDALPEHLSMRTGMLERANTSLRENEREIESVRQEKRFLLVERDAALRGSSTAGSEIGRTPSPAEQLRAYEFELADLRARLKDTHPDIVALLRKIEELNLSINENSSQSMNEQLNTTVIRIDTQIRSADRRISSLEDEKQGLLKRVDELEASILEIPQVEQKLNALDRERQNALRKYEEVRSKEMEARLAENLEQQRKGERFTLLEPPVVPADPVEPNLKKTIAFGLLLSIAAGVGGLVSIETMDRTIRSPSLLGQLLHEAPLASIPYITTNREVTRRKKTIIWLTLGFISLLVLFVLSVHLFIQPLDVVLIKLFSQIG
jgi:succinoglycan biosynthesis transport protein ExoP